jgi:hypothetical protein
MCTSSCRLRCQNISILMTLRSIAWASKDSIVCITFGKFTWCVNYSGSVSQRQTGIAEIIKEKDTNRSHALKMARKKMWSAIISGCLDLSLLAAGRRAMANHSQPQDDLYRVIKTRYYGTDFYLRDAGFLERERMHKLRDHPAPVELCRLGHSTRSESTGIRRVPSARFKCHHEHHRACTFDHSIASRLQT